VKLAQLILPDNGQSGGHRFVRRISTENRACGQQPVPSAIAFARVTPRCANAPVRRFQTMAAVAEDFLKPGATSLPRLKI
jgi:hypothetical protein